MEDFQKVIVIVCAIQRSYARRYETHSLKVVELPVNLVANWMVKDTLPPLPSLYQLSSSWFDCCLPGLFEHRVSTLRTHIEANYFQDLLSNFFQVLGPLDIGLKLMGLLNPIILLGSCIGPNYFYIP